MPRRTRWSASAASELVNVSKPHQIDFCFWRGGDLPGEMLDGTTITRRNRNSAAGMTLPAAPEVETPKTPQE